MSLAISKTHLWTHVNILKCAHESTHLHNVIFCTLSTTIVLCVNGYAIDHLSSQNTLVLGARLWCWSSILMSRVFAVRRCMQSSTLRLPPQTSPPPLTGTSQEEDSCRFLPIRIRYRKCDHCAFCDLCSSVHCSHPFCWNILWKQMVHVQAEALYWMIKQ